MLAFAPFPVRRTAREVFRGGDGIHTAKVRHFTKHMRQRIPHPLPYRGMRGAESCELVLPHTCHREAIFEEHGGHGARLVHVEIDADAVSGRAFHKRAETVETTFVTRTKLWKRCSAGGQIAQHNMQPHTVHADGGKPFKKAIGIRIKLRIDQWVAIDREIGVDDSQCHWHLTSGIRSE